MSYYGTYETVARLKAALSIAVSDTTSDVRFRQVLEEASAAIDEHCARWFQPRTQTRYYQATNGDELLLDADLLSISSLKTDQDGDRTYEETWAATDYDLLPDNAWPKTSIQTAPDGDYWFSGQRRGIEIAGIWGYGDGASATPYASSGQTATVATTTGTSLTVSSAVPFGAGQTILVDSEQMYIEAVGAGALIVVRGVNGTTAATHAAATAYIYQYPRPIQRACLRWAARLWRLESAPFGVSGGAGEMGTLPVAEPVDRETLHLLAPFRHLVVG